MKMKTYIITALFVVASVFCSCGSGTSATTQNTTTDQQVAELQRQLAELQQQLGNQNNQSTNQTQAQTQTQNQAQNQAQVQNQTQQGNQFNQAAQGNQLGQNNQQFGNTNGGITMDQAKQIATTNAGLDVNSVTYIKTIQDYDNGFLKWEIDFVANNMKYEYDISASNGTILKAEREGVAYQGYVPQTNMNQQGFQGNMAGGQNFGTQGNAQGISVDEAKNIAVQHAGFNIANVTFVKQKYDFDDGMAKWELEFVVNTNKYEYEVSASNGTVLKYQVESIYND